MVWWMNQVQFLGIPNYGFDPATKGADSNTRAPLPPRLGGSNRSCFPIKQRQGRNWSPRCRIDYHSTKSCFVGQKRNAKVPHRSPKLDGKRRCSVCCHPDWQRQPRDWRTASYSAPVEKHSSSNRRTRSNTCDRCIRRLETRNTSLLGMPLLKVIRRA